MRILVPANTSCRHLLERGGELLDRLLGELALKGVQDRWRLHRVVDG